MIGIVQTQSTTRLLKLLGRRPLSEAWVATGMNLHGCQILHSEEHRSGSMPKVGILTSELEHRHEADAASLLGLWLSAA